MELFRLTGMILVDAGNAINNLRRFNDRVSEAGNKLKNMGTKITGFGKSMTTGLTLPILKGFGASIKSAGDLYETFNKIDVAFGKNATEVKNWSNTTLKKFGLARDTALENAAVYADMGSSMGLNAKQTKEMSMRLVELTGDMASFKNMKPDQIHTALTSIFTGETKSLKKLGIAMLVANLEQYAQTKGINKSWKEMTQAEKVMLRYQYVMDATKNSQGDFTRTQASFANQLRIVTEGFRQTSSEIGMLFLPMAVKVITFIRKIMDRFNELPAPIKKVTAILALLVAGIGPLIIGIGTVITVAGVLAAAIAAIGAPAAIVIAIFIPLVASFVSAGAVIAGLAVKTGIFQKALKYLKNLFNGITAVLKGNFKEGFNIFVQKLGLSKEKALTFTKKLISLRNTFDKIAKVAKDVGSLIKAIFSGEKQEVINLLIEKFGYTKDEAEAFWKKVEKVRKKVVELAKKLKKELIPQLTKLIDKLIEGGEWLIDHRKQIAKLIEKIIVFSTKVAKFANEVRKANIKFGKFIGDVWNGIKKAHDAIISFFVDGWDAISTLNDKMYNWGKNAMQNFIDGIASKFGGLLGKVAAGASIVAKYFGYHSPTEEGPGSDADTWAPNLMKMFAEGIANNKHLAINEMTDMMKEIENVSKFSAGISSINKVEMPSVNGNKNGSNITVNLNNPSIFDKRGVSEIMNQVKQELQTYMSYKYSG